jgi:5'(3')-deoxyribonucleotidase
MKIAVDMDDVMVDFIGGLLGSVKKEYGVEIKKEDIVEWNLHTVLDPIIGRSFWKWLRDRERLWATFPAVDGAIGGVDTLRRAGHYMELVTSKPDWAEHNVFIWLGKWRPAFQQVTITKLKDIKAEKSDADVLIDDKPQNCLDWIATGRRAILFTSAHNKSFVQSAHIGSDGTALVRANDWQVIVKMIERLDQTGYW